MSNILNTYVSRYTYLDYNNIATTTTTVSCLAAEKEKKRGGGGGRRSEKKYQRYTCFLLSICWSLNNSCNVINGNAKTNKQINPNSIGLEVVHR